MPATAVRWGLAAFICGAAGWLIVHAANNVRADSALMSASREMGAWAAGRLHPQTATWNSVRERLLQAEALSVDNPTVQELLGLLYTTRIDDAEYQFKGIVHFNRAARLRPVSPYTWANIVEARYAVGDTGQEFAAALRNAVTLGPSEPAVQRTVADYGLAVWDEMGPVERGLIDQMISSGLRRNPLEMLQISERRGRLAVACSHLHQLARAPDPKWYQLCQSTEATL